MKPVIIVVHTLQITHVLALLCEVSPSSLCAIWKSARPLLWLQVPSHVSCALIKSDCRLFSSQNQGLWPSFTVYSCWFVSSVLLSTLLLVPVFPPLPYVSPLQLSGEVISPAHLSVIAVAKSFKALGALLHTFSTRKSVILASQPSEPNFWVLTKLDNEAVLSAVDTTWGNPDEQVYFLHNRSLSCLSSPSLSCVDRRLRSAR